MSSNAGQAAAHKGAWGSPSSTVRRVGSVSGPGAQPAPSNLSNTGKWSETIQSFGGNEDLEDTMGGRNPAAKPAGNQGGSQQPPADNPPPQRQQDPYDSFDDVSEVESLAAIRLLTQPDMRSHARTSLAGAILVISLLSAWSSNAEFAEVPNFAVFGYLPEYRLKDFDYEGAFQLGLTHLIYFSLEADPLTFLPSALDRLPPLEDLEHARQAAFQSIYFNSQLSLDRLPPLEELKRARQAADKVGGKLLLGFGGNARSKGFGPMTRTPGSRAKFLAALSEHLDTLKVDGVDYNWEYPSTEQEWHNWKDLMAETKALPLAHSTERPLVTFTMYLDPQHFKAYMSVLNLLFTIYGFMAGTKALPLAHSTKHPLVTFTMYLDPQHFKAHMYELYTIYGFMAETKALPLAHSTERPLVTFTMYLDPQHFKAYMYVLYAMYGFMAATKALPLAHSTERPLVTFTMYLDPQHFKAYMNALYTITDFMAKTKPVPLAHSTERPLVTFTIYLEPQHLKVIKHYGILEQADYLHCMAYNSRGKHSTAQ
eukprot:gene15153-21219_t